MLKKPGLFHFILAIALIVMAYPIHAQVVEPAQVRELRLNGQELEARQLLANELDENVNDPLQIIETAQQNYREQNYRRSFLLYEKMLLLYPGENGIRLEYGNRLYEQQQLDGAKTILLEYEKSGGENLLAYVNLGYLFLWDGEYNRSKSYFKRVLAEEPHNPLALSGMRDLENILRPYLDLSYFFSRDDQPLEKHKGSIDFSVYKNGWLMPSAGMQYNYFNAPERTQNGYWLYIGNRFHWHESNIYLDVKAGRLELQDPDWGEWTWDLQLAKGWKYAIESGFEYSKQPYFSTLSSVFEEVIINRYKVYLKRPVDKSWSGELAAIWNRYNDGNMGRNYYAWFLSTPYSSELLSFKIGYSFNYTDTDSSRFHSKKSIEEVVASGNFENIPGIYDPYFTAEQQIVHSVIFSIGLNLTTKLVVNAGGNIGLYAHSEVPYLYLDEDEGLYIERSFQNIEEQIWEARMGMSYQISNDVFFTLGGIYSNLFFYENFELTSKITFRL